MGEKKFPKPIENDEILTQTELAERWKVSKRWIEEARMHLDLPFFRLGRTIRIRKSEADQWFEQRRGA